MSADNQIVIFLTKGIISSFIPKEAPPIENIKMRTGTNKRRSIGEFLCALASLLIREFIASVFARTLNAPPTKSINPMIIPASTNPFNGAVNKSKNP